MVQKVSLILLLGVSMAFSELGVWVVRDMITSPASLVEIVDKAAELGVERLYVQVVGRADAFYDSKILPRSEMLSQAPEDFDPLAEILSLAKKRGMKISAWMNVFYVCSFSRKPLSPIHVVNAHPEWVTYDDRGYSMLDYTKALSLAVPGIFLDPGLDEVKEFVVEIAEEIASKYDVDEIHLDYIRYPYRTFGYNPTVMKRYRKWIRKAMREGKIKDMSDAFDDFRRDQVSKTVEMIYKVVKKYGKNLSAAVYAYYDSAYNDHFQDWLTWIEKGYLDYAVMMAYDPSVETVKSYIEYSKKRLGNLQKIRVGLGLYKMYDNPELLREMFRMVKGYETDETVLFSYKFINEKVEPVIREFTRSN